MKAEAAEIIGEIGPFADVDRVNGVTYDGDRVWFASGDRLNAVDPANGRLKRSIDVAAYAGTAFDGRHLFQIAEGRIQKVDPKSGRVLTTIPAPGGDGASGLAWAEGVLWVGQYRERKIHQGRWAASSFRAQSPTTWMTAFVAQASRSRCTTRLAQAMPSWPVSCAAG